MPTYIFQQIRTGRVKEIILPISLNQNSPEGQEAVRKALKIKRQELKDWRRSYSGFSPEFTFTSAKSGRLNSAWITEERQKARRLESDVHERQRRTRGKPLDWKDPAYKEAFSGLDGSKRKLSSDAKQTLSRLDNAEVREFAKRHSPKGKKK